MTTLNHGICKWQLTEVKVCSSMRCFVEKLEAEETRRQWTFSKQKFFIARSCNHFTIVEMVSSASNFSTRRKCSHSML